MAYQVSTGVAADLGDLLVKLRDFVVTTTGWTSLQDTVTTGANGQYFSVRSLGESGNERIVLRFFRTTADVITALGYLNWASGSGTQQIGSTSGTEGTGTFIRGDDDDFIKYWFFGSLDRIIVVTRGSRSVLLGTLYAGLYTRARASATRACTNSPAAGTSVVINIADTSPFTVNRFYSIQDDNSFEWFKVTAINTNVSITAEKLFNTYSSTANPRIGEDPRATIITPGTGNFGLFNVNHYLQVPAWRRVPMTQGLVIVTPVEVMYERIGLDAGVGDKSNLWPLIIADIGHLSSGYVGQFLECFYLSQEGVGTDDTITIGSAVYRVIVTGAPYGGGSAGIPAVNAVPARGVFAIRQS